MGGDSLSIPANLVQASQRAIAARRSELVDARTFDGKSATRCLEVETCAGQHPEIAFEVLTSFCLGPHIAELSLSNERARRVEFRASFLGELSDDGLNDLARNPSLVQLCLHGLARHATLDQSTSHGGGISTIVQETVFSISGQNLLHHFQRWLDRHAEILGALLDEGSEHSLEASGARVESIQVGESLFLDCTPVERLSRLLGGPSPPSGSRILIVFLGIGRAKLGHRWILLDSAPLLKLKRSAAVET
jgi:hypothetical protein